MKQKQQKQIWIRKLERDQVGRKAENGKVNGASEGTLTHCVGYGSPLEYRYKDDWRIEEQDFSSLTPHSSTF